MKIEKVSKKSLDYAVTADDIGRVAIVITESDPAMSGTILPEEINNLFVQSIIQDLSSVYNFIPQNIVLTQSDKMKEIDSIIMYGVFKVQI